MASADWSLTGNGYSTATNSGRQPPAPMAPARSGGETRTLNLMVNSHLLCRLSYPGKADEQYQVRAPSLVVQIVTKVAAVHRVAELGQGLRFDLANPLSGHTELLAHLLQGPHLAVVEAEPQTDHLALALG